MYSLTAAATKLMPETEVVLQKRPTAATLVEASRQGTTPSFFDGRTAEQQSRIVEMMQNIPFSPMWRSVLEEADPKVIGTFATNVLKVAENRNQRNLLKATARLLAGYFPEKVLRAEIDLEYDEERAERYKGRRTWLADFLSHARSEYRIYSRRPRTKEKVISDSWITFARKLPTRDANRDSQAFLEVKRAYETQLIAAEAIVDVEPAYANLNPPDEALNALAVALANKFPSTVVSHLRAPQPTRIEATA